MISRRQRLAVEMLSLGLTGRQIAKQLNVHESTVSNWRRVQEFRHELARRQSEIIGELRSRLLQGSDVAIAALIRVAGQEDDLPSAVQACKCLLTHSKIMPESAGGLAGCDLATGPTSDMSAAAQTALQELEAHQDGYCPESAWIDYLRGQGLLDDGECITALIEDADFLTKTLADCREWQASQHADAAANHPRCVPQ